MPCPLIFWRPLTWICDSWMVGKTHTHTLSAVIDKENNNLQFSQIKTLSAWLSGGQKGSTVPILNMWSKTVCFLSSGVHMEYSSWADPTQNCQKDSEICQTISVLSQVQGTLETSEIPLPQSSIWRQNAQRNARRAPPESARHWLREALQRFEARMRGALLAAARPFAYFQQVLNSIGISECSGIPPSRCWVMWKAALKKLEFFLATFAHTGQWRNYMGEVETRMKRRLINLTGLAPY